MVDRPIRPGFPDGFKREVHIVCTLLVVDGENLPDTICVAGASAALLGAAPFDGPAACVRIGRDIETGEFIVNPTVSEQENSDLELTIAGTADYISMVEAGADEISEEDMLAAMTFGQEAIAAFCEKQAAFLAKVNPTPMDYTIHAADPSVAERVDAHLDEMSAALKDADKAARMQKVEELKALHQGRTTSPRRSALPGAPTSPPPQAREKKAMRAMVIATGERRRPHPRGDPPAVHRAGVSAPRARLGPVPARPDPGHVRVHPGNAQRVAAPRHHRPRRGQALHAPVQLPAVLHRRDRPHGGA